MALVTSPEYLMPPSAMTGMLCSRAARYASAIAVICGMPAPVTIRVVQMEPGPMPTLTASAPASMSASAPSYVATLPASRPTFGKRFFTSRTASRTREEVAVGRIDGQHVSAGADQFGSALHKVAGGADGSAHAQPALIVLAGVGVFELLLDVLDGDETFELVLFVDHEQLFHAMLVQNQLGLFECGAHGYGDEIFFGHHFADGNVGTRLEA